MRSVRKLQTLAICAIAAASAVAVAAPAPGGHELVLRKLIAEAAQGRIDYGTMTPELAAAVRAQAGAAQSDLTALGPLKSVSLTSEDASGGEHYRTDFEHGALEWAFSINAQGLIENARYRRPAP